MAQARMTSESVDAASSVPLNIGELGSNSHCWPCKMALPPVQFNDSIVQTEPRLVRVIRFHIRARPRWRGFQFHPHQLFDCRMYAGWVSRKANDLWALRFPHDRFAMFCGPQSHEIVRAERHEPSSGSIQRNDQRRREKNQPHRIGIGGRRAARDAAAARETIFSCRHT